MFFLEVNSKFFCSLNDQMFLGLVSTCLKSKYILETDVWTRMYISFKFTPEPPEVLKIWAQSLMFPGPGVPSAVPNPHIIAGICQYITQTGVGKVGDPIAAGSQKSMLKEDC